MSAPSTMMSPQQLVEAAKAPIVAFNDKNWTAARACLTPDSVYDEVATGRKVQGADEVIALWQGWATAFPDARATFHGELAGGGMALLEHTWNATHRGPLQMPTGSIPATGKRIEVRACMVVTLAGDKAAVQRHYFDMATMLRQLGVGG
jgi:steroid delta-isomerase-like uncharacterized protein